MPGVSISTMNAVIWFFGLPFTIFGGVFAMTMITPRLRAIRAPEFFTIEDEILSVGRRFRVRFHLRWIGADLRFQ